jgi:hypothetical protein
MQTTAMLTLIRSIVEIAAYIAAVLFFVYKVYSGYLVSDLSIQISCERQRKPGNDGKDYLGIIVKAKKGNQGAIELNDAQVRARSCLDDHVIGPYPLTGIDRLKRTKPVAGPPSSKHMRSQVIWDAAPNNEPRTKMPPGDETQLAAFIEIDSHAPYYIEAVMLGRMLLHRKLKPRFGQWRATVVSLPVADDKPILP